MRAVDTNLLVRLLVRNNAAQVVAAESFIENGAWVSHLVLAEALWVLNAVYERKPKQIAKAIEHLLSHKQLTLQDADVIASALEDFKREVESLGRRALALPLDVRSYESIHEMVEQAVAGFGKIDILVNNAGCNVRKPALEVTWEDWNLVLDTNLRGTFFVAQAVARHMIPSLHYRMGLAPGLTQIF